MALTVRVIPVVLYDGLQAVKTKQFSRPRNVGHVINLARLYNAREVDELVLLDISGRGPNFDTIEQFSGPLFSPFAVGGGFESLDQVERAFSMGADKIVIRTHTKAIEPLVSKYGRQAIVGSIDARKIGGTYYHQVSNGVMIEVSNYASALCKMGVGEILLQSVDRDGLMQGYDCDLIGLVASVVDCPVIACSGAGVPEHAVAAIRAGADAVAMASIFHFTEFTPNDIKRVLRAAGIPVRLAA